MVLSLVGLPGPVAANEFSGAVTLSYGDTHFDGAAVETLGLDGRVELVTETGLSFRGRFDSVTGSIDGLSGDASGSLFGMALGYRMGEVMGAGLYLERAEIDDDSGTVDGAVTSYGVTLGLVNGGFNLDGFYGQSKDSPQSAGVKVEDYGLFASYEAVPNLTLGGNFVNTRVTDSGVSSDLLAMGAAAAYVVNEQITVFGAAQRSDLADFDVDVTNIGLGVSYDTTAVSRFGSVLSLELARNSLSAGSVSLDGTTLRLGVTLPFGSKAAKVPDNSVAGAVLRPTHSAVSSMVLSTF